MKDKPNFLFIMTDQQRADWLGCYGHPIISTPHIDRIASQGTRFDQFFVATPVCMPNRASFMTGRYPTLHGLRYNGCVLSKRANTFVDVLKSGGYRTASIGKSHLQPMTNRAPSLDGPTYKGVIDEAWKSEASGYANEHPSNFASCKLFQPQTPYYGFDYVDFVTLHGDRAGGHYQQWFRNRHANWEELVDRANELTHDYTCPQAYRTPIPEKSYPTFYIRDEAKSYLTDAANYESPFFAFVSFPDPHHPFNPPGKYWDMYEPSDFEIDVAFSDHHFPPPPLDWARKQFLGDQSPKSPEESRMLGDNHLKEAMALSAGMISMIDDAVGSLIQTLKDTGLYENTVVVFNADHGDYLGDSNLLLKGAWSRDSINKVPMIWSDPGDRTHRVSQAMASTIDLSATILERAGLTPYFGIQGRSFLSCIQGENEHRDEIYIEYNDGGARMGFERPARVRTLQNRQWRISIYGGEDWGELYDLQTDPSQIRNLWSDPEFSSVRAELTLMISHTLIAQMDESPRSRFLA